MYFNFWSCWEKCWLGSIRIILNEISFLLFVKHVFHSQNRVRTAEESYQTSSISFSLRISSRKYFEVNSQDAQECYNHLQKQLSSTWKQEDNQNNGIKNSIWHFIPQEPCKKSHMPGENWALLQKKMSHQTCSLCTEWAIIYFGPCETFGLNFLFHKKVHIP